MNRNYQNKIDNLKQIIKDADSILIGGGAGLSTSAGIEYSGKRFQDNFTDFIAKYDLKDMYSSAFYPFETKEEFWAYFSRHIKLNRYDAPVGQVYLDLLKMVVNKDYFVLTTNADGQFFKAGFPDDKVFMVQGDYAKFQCSVPCHKTLYNNQKIIEKMVKDQKNFKIPSSLLPKCPVCGKPMESNLRKDETFVQDEHWDISKNRYVQFVEKIMKEKTVLLELGVGFNTPTIIKYPFENIAAKSKNTTLVRINRDYPQISKINAAKTFVFDKDISLVVKCLTTFRV